ncbi:MAG: efflux RND transporter periplasmic adaptor subunit [Phycisphaerae bacterium]
MKKFVVILVIAAVVLVGSGYMWYAHAEATAANSKEVIPTVKVERKSFRVSVQSQGAVASNRDVDIKCKASGNIVELPYKDVAAAVAPGALLLRLDTKDQDRAIDSANAVVDADKAKLREAEYTKQIAELSLETTRQKNEADLASAKARANDAHQKALRTEQLFNDKLASKEDLETAETAAAQADADVATAEAAIAELQQQKIQIDTRVEQIKEMQAQLKQDQAKADTAQTNKDYCTVTSPPADNPADPPNWRISKLTAGVALGYLVQSGSSGSSGGTTIMTLADMSHVFVLATVAESDIGGLLQRFEAGQELPVEITADAYPGVKFRGKVVRIAETGVSTSNVVTFEVKIEVTSANRSLLRPLMTADVDIISAERPDALLIPVQAFSKKRPDAATESATQDTAKAPTVVEADATASETGAPRHGRRGNHQRGNREAAADAFAKLDQPVEGTVTVIGPSGEQEQRDVTVGITDGASYEVLSGLKEGETVALNRIGADSKWRGNHERGGGMMRGMGH